MLKLLIVDDDRPFREMLHAALGSEGLAVAVAANAEEGLAMAASEEIGAVLTDFDMPVCNGLKLCRELRKQNEARGRHMPVWLMTGTPTVATHEAVAAGAKKVFRKPFRVADLCREIRRDFAA